MVFKQKGFRKRRSSRQRITSNNSSRNAIDLMELVRSRTRYHPYEFDSNYPAMTASRRSQNSLRNSRHDMNRFYRSVYGEISPQPAASYTEGREDMATNTSLTSFPALAQPQELPTTSMATHSAKTENDKAMDQHKIDNVNKDTIPTSSCLEDAQPKFLSPVSQTSSKSSTHEVNTDESPSSVSFIEEAGSIELGFHINTINTDSAGSSSDMEKSILPAILADLLPTQNSSENSAASDSTIDVVPQEDVPEEASSSDAQIAADEEAGGDGEHNNNSVIEIEITLTTTNDTNSDEDEYEAGDEES